MSAAASTARRPRGQEAGPMSPERGSEAHTQGPGLETHSATTGVIRARAQLLSVSSVFGEFLTE